jgi:hypothetical protein
VSGPRPSCTARCSRHASPCRPPAGRASPPRPPRPTHLHHATLGGALASLVVYTPSLACVASTIGRIHRHWADVSLTPERHRAPRHPDPPWLLHSKISVTARGVRVVRPPVRPRPPPPVVSPDCMCDAQAGVAEARGGSDLRLLGHKVAQLCLWRVPTRCVARGWGRRTRQMALAQGGFGCQTCAVCHRVLWRACSASSSWQTHA